MCSKRDTKLFGRASGQNLSKIKSCGTKRKPLMSWTRSRQDLFEILFLRGPKLAIKSADIQYDTRYRRVPKGPVFQKGHYEIFLEFIWGQFTPWRSRDISIFTTMTLKFIRLIFPKITMNLFLPLRNMAQLRHEIGAFSNICVLKLQKL